MRFRYLTFTFLVFFFGFAFGQNLSDSLTNKSFEELFRMSNKEKVLEKREIILSAYLAKAKKENNIEELMTCYHIYAVIYEDERSLVYADSILFFSKSNKNHFNSASAYQIKGGFYHGERDLKKALDNFVLAKKYAEKSENNFMIFYNNLSIGIIKDIIGEHKDALNIHKQNYVLGRTYIKNKDNYAYLQSIYGIAFSYNHLKELDSATYYNDFGYKEASLLKESPIYFILNQGITHYHKNEYYKAIDSLTKAIKTLRKIDDKTNLAEALFYTGQSHEKINNDFDAIEFYKKVDTIFLEKNFLAPELRGTYEFLINYYKKTNDLRQELTYVNRLMKLDSILYETDIYLNKKIIKEYDIPILLSEKERIIKASKKRKLLITTYFFWQSY